MDQQSEVTKEAFQTVIVRRQWNDYNEAEYALADINDLRWDDISGGVQQRMPGFFLCGYVLCDAMVSGTLSHSCRHGSGPHRIKIVICKKGNDPKVYKCLADQAGPKPQKAKRQAG